MKKRELMVGNLVGMNLKEHSYNIFEILEVGETCMLRQCNAAFFFHIDSIEPIRLTEDWLIKLGAKKFSKDWTLHGVIIHTRKRGFVINRRTPILEFVHILQNYILAARGKDLTVKQQ